MKILKLALILLFLFAPFAFADEALETQVKEIAHQLRCPTCQALSVKESEAGLASNMKTKIRQMLQSGKSEAEIQQYFVDRYGEWILRSPPKTGSNLFLWLAPGVLTAIAAFGVILFVRGKSPKAGTNKLTPLTEAEKKKIDDAIEEIS